MSGKAMASTGRKKAEPQPVPGQKSIASFFGARGPKAAKRPGDAADEAQPAKRLKPEAEPAGDATPAGGGKRKTPGKEAATPASDGGQPSKRSPAKKKAPAKRATPGSSKAKAASPAEADAAMGEAASPAEAEAAQKTAAAAGSPAKGEASQAQVGQRVRVYWPREREWFAGSVSAVSSKGHKIHVAYDDGDKEWVDLQRQKWELLPASAGGADGEAPKPRGRKLVRKNAAVFLSSGSEESEGESEGEESGSDFEAQASAEESSDGGSDVDMAASDGEASPPPAARRRATAAKPKAAAAKKAKSTPAAAAGAARSTPAAAKAPRSAKAPAARQKDALASALAPATPAPAAAAAAGPSGLAAADWERYQARAAERFPFLRPDRLKDAAGRRPTDERYDARSLHIPPGWFKEAKVSEGQRQWWQFKAANFDSVLLFKMGKFYELFEMDAHTGAEVLGLSYMKGEQPHCGFPEANYHAHAERLARAGLRVCVVEQTETPEGLRARNEQRRAEGKPKAGVVNREMVAVLTAGTLTDPEMLRASPDAAYVLALAELGPSQGPGQGPRIGAAAADCATGQVLLGSWQDDELRTGLRAQLAALQPAELVLPRPGAAGPLTPLSQRVALASLRRPRVERAPFWGPAQTLRELGGGGYFPGGEDSWPPVLQELRAAADSTGGDSAPGDADSAAALTALGGLVPFLRSVLLDRSVVGLGKVDRLAAADSPADSPADSSADSRGDEGQPAVVALDGAALENLEVLEATGGGAAGSLLASLDACATPAGRRLLKAWLVRPLGRVRDVTARQDAVAALLGPAAGAAAAARAAFARVGDLERGIARLCAARLGGVGRDSSAVVLYEDAAKRRVGALLATLRGLQRLQEALAGFQQLDSCRPGGILGALVTPGSAQLPDFGPPLAELLAAADWEAAAKEGRIVPNKGVDAAYDAACEGLTRVDADLAAHLAEVRASLGVRAGGGGVSYTQLHKESHVLEVPEELAPRLPPSFELAGQRKGFRRYRTPALTQHLQARGAALQAKEEAMAGILQGMVARFAERQALWSGAVGAMAQLDALMALAAAAEQASAYGPVCRPVFVRPGAGGGQVFHARELRHAAGAALAGDFVPNDVRIGGGRAPFVLITGPNMGGKSTLLRQVCLAALLAHVGAWVPAAQLELSPVDAIFVRMGARDSILTGQSTFFVELTETAAALNRATPASLVALDELGRGTATSDGAAIASAVLAHLSGAVRCRGLFATHYHRLAEERAADPRVAIAHMACDVASQDDGSQQVTFLYKLAAGACPRSYGTNVARLAGIPAAIVAQAAAFSARLEAGAGLSEGEAARLRRLGRALSQQPQQPPDELLAALRGCP